MTTQKHEFSSKPHHVHSKDFAIYGELHRGNFYFTKLSDLLTVGYYFGVIPFKCTRNGKTNDIRLHSSLANKVR